MQFQGSLGIKYFQDLETNSHKIPMEVRHAFQRAFWNAIGAALVDYGRHIPVLTGDTRKGIIKILEYVDSRIIKVGGNTSYAPNLDLEMTESKKTAEDYPEPLNGEGEYKGEYIWPPDSALGIAFNSRKTWAEAIRETNHLPDGATGVDVDYAANANQYAGRYTFFFSHGPEYWTQLDQNGSPISDGPWNLVDLYNEVVGELLDRNVTMIAERISVGIATRVSPTFTLADDPAEADYYWRMSQGSKMGHLDLDFEVLL